MTLCRSLSPKKQVSLPFRDNVRGWLPEPVSSPNWGLSPQYTGIATLGKRSLPEGHGDDIAMTENLFLL